MVDLVCISFLFVMGVVCLCALFIQGLFVLVFGVYDVLLVCLVEQVGFECVYLIGFGIMALLLGWFDVGLFGGVEMVGQVRCFVQVIDVLLVVDVDIGYGNVINVVWIVQDYEQVGAVVLYLEDQILFKWCGYMGGKQVVFIGEMVGKLQVVVVARRDFDLVFIVCIDVWVVEGLDAVLDCVCVYWVVGVDLLFVEVFESVEEIEIVVRELVGEWFVFNWVEGGWMLLLVYERLVELGFVLVIMLLMVLLLVIRVVQMVLVEL